MQCRDTVLLNACMYVKYNYTVLCSMSLCIYLWTCYKCTYTRTYLYSCIYASSIHSCMHTHSTQPTDNTLLKQELVIRKVRRRISPVLFSDKSYKIISMGNCYPVKCYTATATAYFYGSMFYFPSPI